MRYGIGSGALWGLDTVILAIALALNPFATDAHASLVSAALHDAICALIPADLYGCARALKGHLAGSAHAQWPRGYGGRAAGRAYPV